MNFLSLSLLSLLDTSSPQVPISEDDDDDEDDFHIPLESGMSLLHNTGKSILNSVHSIVTADKA